ncbi:S9 family peptidase [Brachybacterium sp. FME24]|uniref:alpha/beta hydrolase family protein n=1 Tax=Brachybacterium sp. FME24 TaxID=2742605 RepID=UPI001865AA18|nr:S9 family peptidase [Brachybacterium sp. FME24]
MQPLDIELLTSLSRPSLAPDGSFAVYSSSRPDVRANRAVGQLWRIDLTDGAAPPRRLTRGIADTSPQLSPDGTTIAFLRPDARDRPQLHLLDARGGEPLQLTDQLLGVGEVAWSPDGSHLAFIARVAEPGRYGSVAGLDAAAEAPRRITGLRWHADGVGFSTDRPTQVFLVGSAPVDAEPAYPLAPHPSTALTATPAVPHQARQLTDTPAEHSTIVFSADGSAILTVREAYEESLRDLRTELISLPLDGGKETVLLEREDGFRIGDMALLGDGTTALLASRPGNGRDSVAPDLALWLLEADGPRRVIDPEALELGGRLVPIGQDVLLGSPRRGRVHLLRITRDGEVRPVLDGEIEVQGYAAAGDTVLAAVARPDTAGALILAADDGPSRTLVDTAADLRALGLVRPRELEITGRSGYPVHGWTAVPYGTGPFPTILMIHGGPHAAYGVSVFDEVQTLVAEGYAVVYGNPRGSAGYGRDHARALRGAFGTVDFEDVIDLLEGALAADERLDPERLGIMGGSYGGYLTAWTIAHDHRFRGAIVERGFLDPMSFQGTSDIGSYFGDEYIGTDPEDIARQSAFAAIAGVRTPTFVIHAENDLRCPLEQGTRYYSALVRQGVPAEMLIVPGEHHELTRTGQPRHRVERFEAVLDWWRRVFSPSTSDPSPS